MNQEQKFPVIAVLGPTASGKSSLAMELAQEFAGVIVNCDSRQIYRGMDIGTAKPTSEEQRQIEHHLFDIIDPIQQFSAGDYLEVATFKLRHLAQQQKLAILTGGTGFYYSALADGLPPTASDTAIARELQQQFEQHGLEALLEQLASLDPSAYKIIDRNNSRRVLRALEVIKVTGRPFAENLAQKTLPDAVFLPIVVTRPREVLHSRIEIRIKEMLDLGLEKEVRNLIEKYGDEAPGLNSIGYREWFDFFAGQKNINQVFTEILINSRQYAKRQETWFRKKPGAEMRDLEAAETREAIFSEVRNFLALFRRD